MQPSLYIPEQTVIAGMQAHVGVRAMDYFRYSLGWDKRMTEGMTYLNEKQNKDGT